MIVLKIVGILIATAIIAYALYLPIIAERKRQGIVKVGADLIPPNRFLVVYTHDLQATRCLERVLQQDRTLAILSDEDRVEAERLVKAFYNDKGD